MKSLAKVLYAYTFDCQMRMVRKQVTVMGYISKFHCNTDICKAMQKPM